MSAVNIVTQPHRALIATDAAVYDGDGVLMMLRDKCRVTANGKLAITGRGNAFFSELVAKYVSDLDVTFDGFVGDSELVVNALFARAEPLMMEHAGKAWNDLWIVGWSDRHRQPKIIQWSNAAPDGMPSYAIVESVLAPETSPEADARILRAIGPVSRATVDYEKVITEITKAQRFDKGVAKYGAEDKYLVGGHIQITEVTAKGITKRIVHTWPEDRIGEKIRPTPDLDPASHPNVTAMPMNRADRRRLEKAQRRGAA